MNDDGDDDDDCSGDSNEEVIKPTKTSVNGAIDTLMTQTSPNLNFFHFP